MEKLLNDALEKPKLRGNWHSQGPRDEQTCHKEISLRRLQVLPVILLFSPRSIWSHFGWLLLRSSATPGWVLLGNQSTSDPSEEMLCDDKLVVVLTG